MCARFEITDSVKERLLAAAERADPTIPRLTPREVRPGDNAPALTAERGGTRALLLPWGMPRWDGKGLIINTRQETAGIKAAFRDCLRLRRAAIPAHVFYEWDAQKNMVTFALPGRDVLWLAGIYDADGRCSVLTTEANASVLPYHPRMPVLLEESALRGWLMDKNAAMAMLSREMPALDAFPEQLTLFD